MKKVLITGGNGDIAKAITRQLENNEFTVYNPPKKQLDVTDIDTIINCIKFFKPDILINCAGYIEPSPIIETSHCRFMKHLEVNLVGAFLCSKYALINNPKCIIINIGSSAGLHGKKDWSAYCASKAGLISLTESLHEEGYRAVCISLSRTNTKMRTRLYGVEDKKTLLSPDEVAEVVLTTITYLDKYSYSGKNILVKKDGREYVYTEFKNYN